MEIKCNKSFITLLHKALVHIQVNYDNGVFGARAIIVPAKIRHTKSNIDNFQHQKRVHCKYVGRAQLRELTGGQPMHGDED